MLNKTLLIAALTFVGVINLQAINENEKNPAAGALVCNKKETTCLNNKESDKPSASTPFFDVSEDDDKEVKDLSCDKQEKKEASELAYQKEDKKELNYLGCEPKDKNQLKFFACKDCR